MRRLEAYFDPRERGGDLEAVGAKGRPTILSTGLSTLVEVEQAVAAVRKGGCVPLAVLQCTSEYPAPDDEMNVHAMTTLAATFRLSSGLSDHSRGMEAAIAAVALGARIVEKHFTTDKSLQGPDHQASLDPDMLTAFVAALRNTEVVLGDGIKRPTASELRNMDGIRRSVVSRGNIAAGTRLSADLLSCKRPGTGIAPAELQRLIGRTVRRDLQDDEPINWDDLE